jgi:hypothetical protein
VYDFAIVASYTYVLSCGLVLLQRITTDICIVSSFSGVTCTYNDLFMKIKKKTYGTWL